LLIARFLVGEKSFARYSKLLREGYEIFGRLGVKAMQERPAL